MASETPTPTLLERLLAYASLSIIAVALLSFFATLFIGLNDRKAMAEGLWPFVYGFSLIGLPIGFALLVTLLIVSQAHRRRSMQRRSHK